MRIKGINQEVGVDFLSYRLIRKGLSKMVINEQGSTGAKRQMNEEYSSRIK